MSKAKPSTVLEVEDEEQRQDRIRTLLERLNETSKANAARDVASGPRIPGILDCKAYPIEPPTELLSRVQAFLPALRESNEALAQQNPEDLDIENIGKDEEQYIEMNLGLGVFEAKRRRKNASNDDSGEDDSDSESFSHSSSGSNTSEVSSESSDRSRPPSP
ncbi:hypothetical protein BKA82DRAFT_4109699 [Pisolithus tinctorius]|nr:hypothetical protein BKA82DRAFT_4109699 [Pisolithus tinctorius]